MLLLRLSQERIRYQNVLNVANAASNMISSPPDCLSTYRIAHGDDALFLRNKEMIGSFLWTQEEAYALAFPVAPASASELRVISYVLPQTTETRTDQRMEKQCRLNAGLVRGCMAKIMARIIGDRRVSTFEQNTTRQLDGVYLGVEFENEVSG